MYIKWCSNFLSRSSYRLISYITEAYSTITWLNYFSLAGIHFTVTKLTYAIISFHYSPVNNLKWHHCSHDWRLRKFLSCKFKSWHSHLQFKCWSLWDHSTVNTLCPTSLFTFPSPGMALALEKVDVTSCYRGRARVGGRNRRSV